MGWATSTEPIRGRCFELWLDAFVVFFGVWTLFCNLLVAARASFHLLLVLSPLPVAASAALMIPLRRCRAPDPEPSSPREARLLLPYKLAAAAGLVVVGAWTQHYAWFWAAAAGCGAFEVINRSWLAEPPGSWTEWHRDPAAIAMLALVYLGVWWEAGRLGRRWIRQPLRALLFPMLPVLACLLILLALAMLAGGSSGFRSVSEVDGATSSSRSAG